MVRKISSFIKTLRQFIVPAFILAVLLASPVGARCIGSSDPLILRMELEIGHDPAAGLKVVSEEIADADPAEIRRLAELHIAKAQALYMSGKPYRGELEKARSLGGPFARTDNIGMYLRIGDAVDKLKGAESVEALQAVARDYEALPDGSSAKTCRGADLAFFNSLMDQSREAMMFATRAYRNSGADADSIERAKAASVLALLVSRAHDFDYANELHSEAYAILRKLDQSDLAANEILLRGYTHLARGEWRQALSDFEQSKLEARSYGNEYASDYALLGVCEAALEGELLSRAAPACERAYEGLAVPDERMRFPAIALKARLRVAQGEPDEALRLLDPLISDGKGRTPPGTWIMALETRAEALSMLGRNSAAYAMMREVSAETEAFNESELESGVAALQARFQTEELQRRLSAEERASDARMRLAIAVIAGAATALVLFGALIFSLLQHRRRFRRLAMTDPLTGLANRRATLEKAEQALRIVGMVAPRASFALIDIDHFKTCNDTFGHDAGDRVLSEFAQILRDGVRPTDIVGRWGGEEFLVVFPATDAEHAAHIIERVRASAACAQFDFAPEYRLTFSAGIATLEETDDRTNACIKLADKRLYAAKDQGRDRTCIGGHADDIGVEPAKDASHAQTTSAKAA